MALAVSTPTWNSLAPRITTASTGMVRWPIRTPNWLMIWADQKAAKFLSRHNDDGASRG
ncbi:hypothetical protein [Arthrobacter sp. NPDC089319]|uniref:hypothetical protein n=1 Tax=Arthrobacter sp. NPDC089319 TaxID=3155915 RepID=UPI0034464F64